MRKILVLVTLLIAVVTTVYFTSCNSGNSKEADSRKAKEDSIANVVARGKYLALHVAICMDCHSKRDFTKYSGPIVPGTEGGGGELFDSKVGVPGMIYARNITPDNETGIGTWTDEDLVKAITQGISKRGDTLFPIMPYANYNRMAKEDVLSIIAYIRTLKPINNKIQDRKLPIPMAMVYPKIPLQPSVDGNVKPDASDRIKYGGYLTTIASCGECHSPLTPMGPDRSKIFSGNYPFQLPTNTVVSANITPDSATGIGTWNEARFLDKFALYRKEENYNYNPGQENTMMPVSMYSGMTDADLKAIYAFLKTAKPISNKVEKFPKP